MAAATELCNPQTLYKDLVEYQVIDQGVLSLNQRLGTVAKAIFEVGDIIAENRDWALISILPLLSIWTLAKSYCSKNDDLYNLDALLFCGALEGLEQLVFEGMSVLLIPVAIKSIVIGFEIKRIQEIENNVLSQFLHLGRHFSDPLVAVSFLEYSQAVQLNLEERFALNVFGSKALVLPFRKDGIVVNGKIEDSDFDREIDITDYCPEEAFNFFTTLLALSRNLSSKDPVAGVEGFPDIIKRIKDYKDVIDDTLVLLKEYFSKCVSFQRLPSDKKQMLLARIELLG